MLLTELMTALTAMDTVQFTLPDGSLVASHFHITEVGQTTKRFIDCGGTAREEHKINLQLWQADDLDHRLTATKLKRIVALSTDKLSLPDAEVQVEYQGSTTLETYNLEVTDGHFTLQPKHTACLAEDACGIEPVKMDLTSFVADGGGSCSPGSGCC